MICSIFVLAKKSAATTEHKTSSMVIEMPKVQW